MRFVFLTMEVTNNAALREAGEILKREHGIDINFCIYNVALLRGEETWQNLAQDVANADFVFGSMLFGEDVVRPLEHILAEVSCPICIITSNPALIRCTHLGKFDLHSYQDDNESGSGGGGLQSWMNKLRPKHGHGESQRQLALVRGLSKVLKFIPGRSRDLYNYISTHQYWLNGSPENLVRMLCMIMDRYVPGYKGTLPVHDPLIYPDVAICHPDAPTPFTDLASYQKWQRSRKLKLNKGSVGLLSMRAAALGGNMAHIEALTRALEERGVEVRIVYSGGLDFRPAIDKFFFKNQKRSKKNEQPTNATTIDLLLNGTGFSLVGGPAESRPNDAQAALNALNVGYLDMIPLAFQRIDEWQGNDIGLAPIQLALSVAVPELDGAAEPRVYGGPANGCDKTTPIPEEIELTASRVSRRVGLRTKTNADKKIAVVLFNFPPNLGSVGTAAYLDVFASLHRFLLELKEEGYTVEVPETVEALRQAVVEGNNLAYGTDGNLADRFPVANYIRLFPAYKEIEPYWGKAPGELLNDGKHFYILGRQFGNVFVGQQPSFGYERDPMRLLMAKDAAPHHGFAAFYTWIEHTFGADAVVHFGTHGALEFMPGKQAGLSSKCWPTRLLGSLPNVYYYCVNNPSEGTIAKRRGAATLVSYMVPPLKHAGLYKGLRLLKDSLDTYRQKPSPELLEAIRAQAEKLDIVVEAHTSTPLSPNGQPNGKVPAANITNTTSDSPPLPDDTYVAALTHELIQIEQRMIPMGLHVLGKPASAGELADILALVAAFTQPDSKLAPLPQMIARSQGWDYEYLRTHLKVDRTAQERWEQLDAICRETMNHFVRATLDTADTHDAPDEIVSPEIMASTFETRRSATETYLHKAAGIKPGTLRALWNFLNDLTIRIVDEQEVQGLLRALEGGYISPSPGNDVVRNPAVVPTGRNLHGLDPFRMPSTFAQEAGARLVEEMIGRMTRDGGELPETIAMVLWGTDNLKSDGEGVAQVLALLGARAKQDELGNVSDVALIPLEELGRPRIDTVVTVSGIFRDLLTHQMRLLDKAVHLAAAADEPPEQNFVRKHALAQAAELGVSLEEAATRIFSNAPGSYGANVNHLIESGTWDEDEQLSEAFMSRKSFTLGADGEWKEVRSIMESALTTVDAAFQNIDSFEIGISDVDHYYEYLGGVTKSVEKLRSKRPSVMVADAIATSERVSSLEQMVRLESRAKLLNPRWFEAMLNHGYEGVHEIEARVNNTYGWSATAEAVEGWVYQGVAETYLLDEAMRERLAKLNPHATTAITRRLLEANARGFWDADESTLEELREIYDDLEDRLEGVGATERSVGL
jgi:magnesium chelatase subunit H